MLIYAAILFVLAALGGLLMVGGYVVRGKNPPLLVAGLHGVFGAGGLLLLLYPVVTGSGSDYLRISLVALVVAAAGGFYLLVNHLSRSRVRLGPVLIHALVAVFGVGVLIAAILGYG